MIIAIDGPAGAGKGTISGYLAMKFDLQYLDTGLLYRALAKAIITKKIAPHNAEAVADVARTITVDDVHAPDLRGEEVAAVASQVAVIAEAGSRMTAGIRASPSRSPAARPSSPPIPRWKPGTTALKPVWRKTTDRKSVV